MKKWGVILIAALIRVWTLIKKGGNMTVKKNIFNTALCLVCLVLMPQTLTAQTTARAGKEVPNLLSAVKSANPGDYILLPSGKKYILTKEEIEIAKGTFDYEDLSEVKTETLGDGTEVKTISEAHVAYIYPDGQAAHILKTGVSFTAYLENYIEKNYYIGRYIDRNGKHHDMQFIGSPRFKVFRASVQFQKISNGREDAQMITVTAYNHEGKDYMMRYYSGPGWAWGNVRDGGYRATGETRQLEFEIE